MHADRESIVVQTPGGVKYLLGWWVCQRPTKSIKTSSISSFFGNNSFQLLLIFFFQQKVKSAITPSLFIRKNKKKRKKHPLAPHKKLNKSAQRFVRLSLTRRPLLDQAPPLMAGRANQQAPPFFDGRPCLYAAIIWRITVSTHTHTRAGVKWRRRIRFLKNEKKKYFFLSSRNWDANQAIWTRRSDETPSDLWRLLSKVLS